MTAQPTDTAPVAPSPATGAQQEPAAAAPAAPIPASPAPHATAAPAPAEPVASPWADNPAAVAEIERLRKEAGAARTTAKAQAATEARAELAQQIGKALGLVQDEPVDPAQLTEQLATQRAEAAQAKVALAVYQAAATAGGDPIALLDSSTFQAKVKDIDPTDAAAITAAITAAVAANPRLAATPAGPPLPGVPAPNPAQGTGASGDGGPDAEYERFFPPAPTRKQ